MDGCVSLSPRTGERNGGDFFGGPCWLRSTRPDRRRRDHSTIDNAEWAQRRARLRRDNDLFWLADRIVEGWPPRDEPPLHVRLIAVGKVRERYLAAAVADFRARLRPYHRLDEIEVRAADGADPARAVHDRRRRRSSSCSTPSDHVWLLERARRADVAARSSSRRIERLPHAGIARLTLVVAGTYGASDALLARADVRWSLSPLTLLHEWARALVLEQLYRAAKIARDEPYHH